MICMKCCIMHLVFLMIVAEFDGVDLSGGDHDNNGGGDENVNSGNKEISNDDTETFYNLLKDAEQELYPGCKKFIKLSFNVRLFHIKCLYGLSDKSITVLLELFKEALPKDPRNVRLSLVNDGFNPFGTMSISHNTWPVVLMMYNFATLSIFNRPSRNADDNDSNEDKLSIFTSVGDVSYIGNVVDVIELDYYRGRKVALFKCDWIDINSNRGTKKDELGFTRVNPSCSLKTEEPFILASQAIQVFYVEDPVEPDWNPVEPDLNPVVLQRRDICMIWMKLQILEIY
ncbi:hypothetical protein Ddye_032224 [Dipteronia dyeriana]|uniref:DUF4216 domain-containing protein n=1 Tax=Dipteronia dyeriana TaxID=168575 RepID=A0AAD9TJU9_9ROSI|nr:hypothetical protein Ddye_032224 [Dipteronia dyeriana]